MNTRQTLVALGAAGALGVATVAVVRRIRKHATPIDVDDRFDDSDVPDIAVVTEEVVVITEPDSDVELELLARSLRGEP